MLSANAFDKNLENDVGITPDNFIVKPFQLAELLDWLGRVLELEWITADRPLPPPAPAEPPPLVPPAGTDLAALEQLIDLGYPRGILDRLAEIERQNPAHGEFVRILRDLARQFQFDPMKEIIRKARDAER